LRQEIKDKCIIEDEEYIAPHIVRVALGAFQIEQGVQS
jgi:hypothetical protein